MSNDNLTEYCDANQISSVKDLHDQMFLGVMQDPRIARDLFIRQYPAEVIAKLDLETLTLCPNTFVDEVAGDKGVVDVLYKMQYKKAQDNKRKKKKQQAPESAYLYILTEAQFKPCRLMPWRMLKYTVRIIDYHLEASKSEVLPVVLPLLIHQGKSRYPYPTSIFALCNDPELARGGMFDDMNLLDASQLTAEEIERSGLATLLLGVLHHAHARDMVKVIEATMPYLMAFKGEKNYLQRMLLYIMRRDNIKEKSQLIKVMQQIDESVRSEIMTIQEILLNEGREEGIEKGREEGRIEGERNSLHWLLTSKFTQVSKKYLTLVNNADESKLKQWLKNTLSANKIEEVFN